MVAKTTSYKIPLILAISIHVLLFIALFFHFVPRIKLGPGADTKIINASVVERQGAITNPTKEIVKQNKLVKPQQDMEKLQQQAALAEKQAEQKAAEQKALAQQLAQQKLAAQKAEEIARQQAVIKAQQAAKLQRQQLALAAKQKALAAKKQLAKKLAQVQQQMLQQQIAQEQQQLSNAAATSAHNQEQQDIVDKYKAIIVQTIAQNWLVPDNSDKNLSCQLLIQLAPGGAVLGVQVIQSSGNSALDSSATAAVFKSSPLPVPADPELFDKFRQLRLTVRPENVISSQ